MSVGCGHRERAAEANVARMGVIVVLGTRIPRARMMQCRGDRSDGHGRLAGTGRHGRRRRGQRDSEIHRWLRCQPSRNFLGANDAADSFCNLRNPGV